MAILTIDLKSSGAFLNQLLTVSRLEILYICACINQLANFRRDIFHDSPAVYQYETLNLAIIDSEGNSHILLGAGCDNLPVMTHISILCVGIWD